MKTFFLTIFFFILVAFCALAGIIVAQISPRSWSFETVENGLLDLAEKGALKLDALSGNKVEGFLAEKLGQCQPMSIQRGSNADPIGNAVAVEGVAHFSLPIDVGAHSLLCGFPGRGKPVFLIPSKPGQVVLRRRPNVPGSVDFSGEELLKFVLLSDELNFDILLPGVQLHLESRAPVSLALDYEKAESRFSVVALSGDLDFTFAPLTNSPTPMIVIIIPAKNGKLSSQGKLFPPEEPIKIIPSGVYAGKSPTPLPGFSVGTPFLLSSLFSSNNSGDPGSPQRSWIATLWSDVFDLSSRESIQAMATYFPALSPVRFLCQFTPAKTKPNAVLPGEWINAPAGGKLKCPGDYEVTLANETRMRVRQAGSLPEFALGAGQMEVNSGASDFFFSVPGMSGGMRGHAKHQRILFTTDSQESVLGCLGGNSTVSVRRTGPSKAKVLLASRSCRMEVYSGLGNQARYVFPFDHVYFENLGVPRRSWPQTPMPTLTPLTPEKGEFIGLPLKAASGGKVGWQLPPSLTNADCTLFSQKTDFAPLVEVAKTKGAPTGEATVPAANLPGLAKLACEKDNFLALSSLIPLLP